MTAFDLGFVKAIHTGATPPVNIQMLWYDTGTSLHKYYDVGAASWVNVAGGVASWSSVLATGANTSGTSPNISPGDGVKFENSGFQVTLETGVLSANRTLQLPDKTDTIATLSDVVSAGDLVSVLTLGNTTSGLDIEISAGDRIIGPGGGTSIDMRNAGTDTIRIDTAVMFRVDSANQIRLNATALILLQTTGAPAITVDSNGMGVNGSGQGWIDITSTGVADSSAATEIFRVHFGAQAIHIGQDSNAGFINTYGGWLNINGDIAVTGSATGVGMVVDPTTMDANVYLGIGNQAHANDIITGLVSGAAHAGYFRTYKGPAYLPVASMGHDASGDMELAVIFPGLDMLFKVQAQTIFELSGTTFAFRYKAEIEYENTYSGAIAHPGNASPAIIGNATINAKHTFYFQYTSTGDFAGMGGFNDGRKMILVNISSFATTLQHNNVFVGGNAQFFCPGNVDLVLGDHMSATCVYSSIKNGWVVVATA